MDYFYPMCFTVASHSPIHTHIRCQPCKATTNTSGAVRVSWCLAQGHLNTELGGGARRSNQQPSGCQTTCSYLLSHRPPQKWLHKRIKILAMGDVDVCLCLHIKHWSEDWNTPEQTVVHHYLRRHASPSVFVRLSHNLIDRVQQV